MIKVYQKLYKKYKKLKKKSIKKCKLKNIISIYILSAFHIVVVVKAKFRFSLQVNTSII